jgi:hypothetical protein
MAHLTLGLGFLALFCSKTFSSIFIFFMSFSAQTYNTIEILLKTTLFLISFYSLEQVLRAEAMQKCLEQWIHLGRISPLQ